MIVPVFVSQYPSSRARQSTEPCPGEFQARLTVQADYDPHEEGGEGQSEGEDEDEDDDERGALQFQISMKWAKLS